MIFEKVYIYCSKKDDQLSVVIVPDQELPEFSINLTNQEEILWENNTFYSTTLSLVGEEYIIAGELEKIVIEPTQTIKTVINLAESAERVRKVKLGIKEKQKEVFKKINKFPPIPNNLFIEDNIWNLLSSTLQLNKYPLLVGPKGVGKTMVARCIAEAMDLKFYRFNMGSIVRPKQTFVGMMQAEQGTTKLIKSQFLTAFTSEEPTCIFLDEITRTQMSASNYLMTILDREQNYIYIEEEGKEIYKGPYVKFITAGNIGQQYVDTRTMDGAFWDRFIKIPINYLSEKRELDLLIQRAPKANIEDLLTLVKWANCTREAELVGSISSAISPRQNIDMAHYLEMQFSLDEVKESIFLNNFINGVIDDREKVKTIIMSC